MKKRTIMIGFAACIMITAATSVSAAHAESSTTLITLGTRGGPLPTADRAQSPNLLVVNGALYLIDAGGAVTSRIVQAGYDFRKIGKSLSPIRTVITRPAWRRCWYRNGRHQRAELIEIYGGGVEALVKGAIAYLTPNAEIRWAEGKKRPMADLFRGHDVGSGLVYRDENVKVTAVENTHFHFEPGTAPYGKYHSYSYRFETLGRVVFFTGDTGPTDAVVELAKGADLYVTETTSPDDVVELFKKNGAWQAKTPAEQEGFLRHMHEEHVTPSDIGKMATKAGAKAVIMTHLGPSTNPNDDYQRFADEAKKYYLGPITITKNLMKF